MAQVSEVQRLARGNLMLRLAAGIQPLPHLVDEFDLLQLVCSAEHHRGHNKPLRATTSQLESFVPGLINVGNKARPAVHALMYTRPQPRRHLRAASPTP